MKSKILLGTTLAISLLVSAQTMAADYVIDVKGQHASVNFKANHLGYSYIIGRFNEFSGEFNHDPAKPDDSGVNVTIQAKSLDTNHAERDKHLRSTDFFEVNKYPVIVFESTSFKNGKLTGNLSMHGITKPVTLDVTHIGEGDDPWGGYRSGFEAEVNLKAADFGLPGWVGDVAVTLQVEGVRQLK
ncbi:MAG: polyisoprenoid-binding protein YceI [Urechidicola sp.]